MIAYPRRWLGALRRLHRPLRAMSRGNIGILYREIAWFGVASGIVNTFTSVFAVRLGASNQLLGLLASLPAMVGIVWQLPAARLIERQPHRLRMVLASLLCHRLGYLAIGLLPWILPAWWAQAIVGIVVLSMIPLTLADISFSSMLADIVPEGQRAHVISIRNSLIALTTTVTVLATGRLLDTFPFPINYQGAFLVAFAASMVSLAELAHLRIPGDGVSQTTGRGPAVPWLTVLQDHQFRRFAIASFAVIGGLYTPSALYPIYRVRVLGASDTFIGLIGTVETTITIFSTYFWGRQANRYGHRWVLLIGTLGLAFYPLFTALSPRVEPLLLVSIIGGVFYPGFNLALYSLLLEVCPAEGRPTYLGVYNVLYYIAAFIAPLAGTTLADWLGVRPALLAAMAIRLASAGVLVWSLWLPERARALRARNSMLPRQEQS